MKLLPMALPLIMLAACDSSPDVKLDNAKPSEVAAKVSAATSGAEFVRPGKWRSTVTIEEMAIPGMPPEMAATMKQRMGQARSVESCLTPEQAKKPKEDFFAGVDKSCKYDHFEMDGGKIDATMHCTRDKMVQTMTMSGAYTPDHYEMNMTTKMDGGSASKGMAMKMKIDAKRIGECDAKPAAAG